MDDVLLRKLDVITSDNLYTTPIDYCPRLSNCLAYSPPFPSSFSSLASFSPSSTHPQPQSHPCPSFNASCVHSPLQPHRCASHPTKLRKTSPRAQPSAHSLLDASGALSIATATSSAAKVYMMRVLATSVATLPAPAIAPSALAALDVRTPRSPP